MSGTAIGLVEVSSIALGVRAADAMLKTAPVELVEAGAASPGKYLALVAGDVASVAAAVEAGAQAAGPGLLDALVIAHLHPQVYPALRGEPAPAGGASGPAVGVVETFTVAAAIQAADAAVKAAAVDLLELRLARGLGGKGYLVVAGDVGSVQAAVQAAEAACPPGAHVASTVIPALHAELRLKSGWDPAGRTGTR